MNNKLVKKIVAIGLGTTLAVGTLVAPATLGIGTSVNAQATVEYGPFHTLLDGKIDALIKEAAKHDKKAMDTL